MNMSKSNRMLEINDLILDETSKLMESKDHLIRKLDLDASQQMELIDFFKKRNDMESKIDWNTAKKLDWDFWKGFMNDATTSSKRGAKRAEFDPTSDTPIPEEFIEGVDYINNTIPGTGYWGFTALTHKFQNYVQHERVMGTVGKWCNGQTKSDKDFKLYDAYLIFTTFVDKQTGLKIIWQHPKNTPTGNWKKHPVYNSAKSQLVIDAFWSKDNIPVRLDMLDTTDFKLRTGKLSPKKLKEWEDKFNDWGKSKDRLFALKIVSNLDDHIEKIKHI